MNFGVFQLNFEVNGVTIDLGKGKGSRFSYKDVSIGLIALGLFLIMLNFLTTLGAALFVVGGVVLALTQKRQGKR